MDLISEISIKIIIVLRRKKLPGYLSLALLTRTHTPILGWEIHNLHSVDSPSDTRDSPAFSWDLKR